MALLDAERTLVLSYVRSPTRDRLAALWDLDATLGQVLGGGREPMIARIKLAWWRDALEGLDRSPPPPQPVLQMLAALVLPVGIKGAELSGLEEGWSVLASLDSLDREAVEAHALRRGRLMFALSARLLGERNAPDGGELWALADLARHSRDQSDVQLALAAGRERLGTAVDRWPKRLRPLGMLAKLAARDIQSGSANFERQGSPARMLVMLGHRVTGR